MTSAFSILTLTDKAAERARDILAMPGNADKILKIGVKNGGCAGMNYTLDLVEEAASGAELIEDKGVRLTIAPEDLLFLLGTEMDFTSDTIGSSFSFHNPNQTGSCSCGHSVSITPHAPVEAGA